MEPGLQLAPHVRLWHGAREAFPPGSTHVLPASRTGVPARGSSTFTHDDGTPHTDSAFATPAVHMAMAYATQAESQSHAHVLADTPRNSDPDPKHRSVLYEVEHAHDQQWDGGPEIASKTGFRIKDTWHARPGVTGTFPEVNWNAFKARRSSGGIPDTVSSDDANHWEDSRDAPRTPKAKAPEHVEHPDQLNLFSGHTVAEHEAYVRTPGFALHPAMNQTQFAHPDAFHRDPTTSSLRRQQGYHHLDVEMGTVR